MSRHKTAFPIILVAAMLLLAGSAPAQARGVSEARAKVRVAKYEQYETAPLSSFWRWLKGKTRYAMAAN